MCYTLQCATREGIMAKGKKRKSLPDTPSHNGLDYIIDNSAAEFCVENKSNKMTNT